MSEKLRELVAKWNPTEFEIEWHQKWVAEHCNDEAKPLRYDAKVAFHRAIFQAGIETAALAEKPHHLFSEHPVWGCPECEKKFEELLLRNPKPAERPQLSAEQVGKAIQSMGMVGWGPPTYRELALMLNLLLTGAEKVPPITEMRICEVSRLILHVDQLYRFTVDPNCEDCQAYAAPPSGQPSADGVRCIFCGKEYGSAAELLAHTIDLHSVPATPAAEVALILELVTPQNVAEANKVLASSGIEIRLTPAAPPAIAEDVPRAAKLFERLCCGYTMDDARTVAVEFAAIRREAEQKERENIANRLEGRGVFEHEKALLKREAEAIRSLAAGWKEG